MGGVAAYFLFRVLLAGTLGRFATYLNLDYGNALSYSTTPAAVGRVLAQPARWFRAPPRA